MKILVLSKRHYMSKDLLSDRYGRFFSIPESLAASRASVKGVCLDYRTTTTTTKFSSPGNVEWQSFSARNPIGVYNYLACIHSLLQRWQPDAIWAASDSLHVALGVVLQKLRKTACIIDLYDHFDAYPANHLPGVSSAYHWAVRNSDGITCVSSPLAAWADSLRPDEATNALLLENAIEKNFHYLGTEMCRERLGLEKERLWIGTAGALNTDRGIETLYIAWEKHRSQGGGWGLALAGPRNTPPPEIANDMGILSHEEVPYFFGALNVGVICNSDSLFSKYCFPQKLYEMLACGIPVVAANTGILTNNRNWDGNVLTFTPGNSNELASKIERASAMGKMRISSPPPSWSDRANSLLNYIENSVLSRSHKFNDAKHLF